MNSTMPDRDQKTRITLASIIAAGQILAMIVGFGSVIYAMGERGGQLDRATHDMEKLGQTVREVASVQAAAAVADASNKASIEELRRRMDAVERRLESMHR